jgi:hypothetical protein
MVHTNDLRVHFHLLSCLSNVEHLHLPCSLHRLPGILYRHRNHRAIPMLYHFGVACSPGFEVESESAYSSGSHRDLFTGWLVGFLLPLPCETAVAELTLSKRNHHRRRPNHRLLPPRRAHD